MRNRYDDLLSSKAIGDLMYHDISIMDLRAKASGWHFAQEWLTPEEKRMLYVIEELFKEVDSYDERGFAHIWPSENRNI